MYPGGWYFRCSPPKLTTPTYMTPILQMLESISMLSPGGDAQDCGAYECHRSEQTLLYRHVEEHFPARVAQLAGQGCFHAPDTQGRLEARGEGHWRGDTDTAFWLRPQPQHSFSHPVSGRPVRLSRSSTGKVIYTLKTPCRDGTTQVAFDPEDFIACLAALVPRTRAPPGTLPLFAGKELAL
jgi:hypothetical protein